MSEPQTVRFADAILVFCAVMCVGGIWRAVYLLRDILDELRGPHA